MKLFHGGCRVRLVFSLRERFTLPFPSVLFLEQRCMTGVFSHSATCCSWSSFQLASDCYFLVYMGCLAQKENTKPAATTAMPLRDNTSIIAIEGGWYRL